MADEKKGLSDADIIDEVRKMLDGDDKPVPTPAEAFAEIVSPEVVAKGLGGEPLLGYAIILVKGAGRSVIGLNEGVGLSKEKIEEVQSELVCAFETAKFRILRGY